MTIIRLQDAVQLDAFTTQYKTLPCRLEWQWSPNIRLVQAGSIARGHTTILALAGQTLFQKEGWHLPKALWHEISLVLFAHDMVCEALTPIDPTFVLPLQEPHDYPSF